MCVRLYLHGQCLAVVNVHTFVRACSFYAAPSDCRWRSGYAATEAAIVDVLKQTLAAVNLEMVLARQVRRQAATTLGLDADGLDSHKDLVI